MRSRRKLIRTLAPSYNSTSSINHARGTERNKNGSGSVTSERADKPSPSHQDQSETTKSTPQNVPKPNPSTRSLGTGTINQQRATDSRGGGGRGEVPTRKRSMRRWSGRWERSAILAMRRSAASRVRESSEGGRIGPDLDLERLFIAHSFLELEAKSPLPLGSASPRCPRSSLTAPLPTPAPCCCVCRKGSIRVEPSQAEGRQGGRGGDDRDPRTYRRLLTAFPPCLPAFFCHALPSWWSLL